MAEKIKKARLEYFYQSKKDSIIKLALFIVMFTIFFSCPIQRIGDSKYTMLLSEQLLVNQRFDLDQYFWPYVDSSDYPKVSDGEVWPRHVHKRIGHLYYIYPHGTSMLSIPFVGISRIFGISTINPDGRYNFDGEVKMQKFAASVLMSLLCVIFYITSRLVLPVNWSMVIAISGVLGTQIWSTASRSMQSHTWNVVLLALACFLMLRSEEGIKKIPPIALATILSWGFFVRPTAVSYIIPLSLFMLIRYRRQFLALFTTGIFWLTLFLAYSFYHFGQLPGYYLLGRTLSFKTWGIGLAAQSISPSRGLFIYVPLLIIVSYLLISYRKKLRHQALIISSLTAIFLHTLVVSSYKNWWAGVSYGARFYTDLVPLFVLLGILGTRAALDWYDKNCNQITNTRFKKRKTLEISAFGICLITGMLFNGAGAISKDKWNSRPLHISVQPLRAFDWKRPQFLCALSPRIFAKRLRSEEKTEMFRKLDLNADKIISKKEFSIAKMSKFNKLDKNRDGKINLKEWNSACK